MKKRTGEQIGAALLLSTERPAKQTKQKRRGGTPETPKTVKTSGTGGRPPKDRPKVEKYSAYFTPDQWQFLNVYAAQLTASTGMDADRSAVLRALVDKLRAGDVDVS